jgi:hypothetical protein
MNPNYIGGLGGLPALSMLALMVFLAVVLRTHHG